MREYLREIYHLLGEGRKKIPIIILLFLTSGLMDLLGIGLVGQYISLIVNPDMLSGRIKSFADYLGLTSDQSMMLTWIGGLLVGIFLIKTVLIIFVNYKIVSFSFEQQTRLKSILMQSFQNMPYNNYLERNSAEYVHSIQTFTSSFGTVLHLGLKTVSDTLVGLAILIMLAMINVQALALLVFLLCGVLIGYHNFFRNNIGNYGKKANDAATLMLKGIHEGIEGFKEIRILGKEQHFFQVVSNGARNFAYYTVKFIIISTAPRNLLEFILVVFIVSLVFVFLLTGEALQELIPTIGMFSVAGLRLLPSANALSNTMLQLRFDRHAISELYKDLKKVAIEKVSIAQSDEIEFVAPFQSFKLQKIHFSYSDNRIPALNDISLEIHAGESIGLIGSSGAGKTTLVDVILGLLEPQQGELFYNGKQLKFALDEWRSQIAYLPQQVFLIDNSFRNNIALGVNDKEIDDILLKEALRQARLKELVKQLPDGVDTMLGEHGIRLSGGQRQRVALARAFYHGRNILVMDEATSALDNETEQEINEEIKHFKGKKTMIVIAHRLTTVQHCDRIFRLGDGKIIETGTSNEILKMSNKV